MPTSRRSFLGGLAAICTLGVTSKMTRACDEPQVDSNASRQDDGLKCLDYGLSFICNTAEFNAVRFWIESRTIVFDDRAGTTSEFYQCASCKSENTFGEQDLFYKDNYDFLPILGGDDWLIFRRTAGLSDSYRQVQNSVWGQPVLKLREARKVSLLDSWEKIRDKSAAGTPIVSQTEIKNVDTGLRAVIECPVKTLNVSLERKMYQVDTGPLAFPDLSQRYDPLIDCLRLAFVAFNAPHFADFVVEQPTPVIQGEKEVGQIYHYSNPFSLPAQNRLLAIDDYA